MEASMMTQSKNTHEIADWVGIYSQWDFLLKPEEIVLGKLKNRLPEMRMLDIGVGGGRTTRYFARLAKEYVGIDFDNGMIAACKRKFLDGSGKISFIPCDVRSMAVFEDQHFDLALFSFNGLDYLSHEDRLEALGEIKRVCRVGGLFLFSTHNLNSIHRLFRIRWSRNPIKFLRGLWRPFVMRVRNGRGRALKARQHAMIFDGVYSGKLTWLVLSIWKRLGFFYYSKPLEQVRQIEAAGFKIVATYAEDGKELKDRAELSTAQDGWLYYFCEVLA